QNLVTNNYEFVVADGAKLYVTPVTLAYTAEDVRKTYGEAHSFSGPVGLTYAWAGLEDLPGDYAVRDDLTLTAQLSSAGQAQSAKTVQREGYVDVDVVGYDLVAASFSLLGEGGVDLTDNYDFVASDDHGRFYVDP